MQTNSLSKSSFETTPNRAQAFSTPVLCVCVCVRNERKNQIIGTQSIAKVYYYYCCIYKQKFYSAPVIHSVGFPEWTTLLFFASKISLFSVIIAGEKKLFIQKVLLTRFIKNVWQIKSELTMNMSSTRSYIKLMNRWMKFEQNFDSIQNVWSELKTRPKIYLKGNVLFE